MAESIESPELGIRNVLCVHIRNIPKFMLQYCSKINI